MESSDICFGRCRCSAMWKSGADTTVALQKAGMLKRDILTFLPARGWSSTGAVFPPRWTLREILNSAGFLRGNFAIFRALAPAGEPALIASVAVSGILSCTVNAAGWFASG